MYLTFIIIVPRDPDTRSSKCNTSGVKPGTGLLKMDNQIKFFITAVDKHFWKRERAL
jgi:hypothetical protein